MERAIMESICEQLRKEKCPGDLLMHIQEWIHYFSSGSMRNEYCTEIFQNNLDISNSCGIIQ